MLQRVIKEPPSNLSYGYRVADRARVGKPATKETGRAKARLARPAIENRIADTKKAPGFAMALTRLRGARVPTPGHGIDRDGLNCSLVGRERQG